MEVKDLIPGLPEDVARECLLRVPFDCFAVARSVCQLWHAELDSAGFHGRRKSSGLAQALVALVQSEPACATSGPSLKYAASASTPSYRLVQFQPDSATWSSLPPVPGLPHGLPLFCQVAAAGMELVVVGGWDPESWTASDEVFVYDYLKAAWRRGARMPGPRRSFFACAASDRDRALFVAGGHDEEKNALKSAMKYDVARDEWDPLPDMAQERDECSGVFLRGKFHVIGGYSTEMQGRFGNSAEGYDPKKSKWGPVEENKVETATCPRTCVAGTDERLYMCINGHVSVHDEVKWRTVAEVPEDARVEPSLVAWQGRLMVIGSGSHGGTLTGYALEMGTGKSATWSRVTVPEEYSGHVQAGCSLLL